MTIQARGKDGRMQAKDADGLNAGPPPWILTDAITPTGLFFTRSHAPVPTIDPAAYRLKVSGMVRHPMELSLADLAKLPHRDQSATLICAGLRRSELEAVRPVPGELPWGAEPVANGQWSGVSLREILAQAEVTGPATHVEFIGLDRVERGGKVFGFGGSVPIEKAMGSEVLLADRLNGAPLPAEHGFPVRALVPGYYGARSVKWLGEIVVREGASLNYFQAQAYRVLATPDSTDPRDVRSGTELGELALNSVISVPSSGAKLRPGKFFTYGWAIGPGGETPAKVELSLDGGGSWQEAQIMVPEDKGAFSWRHWRAVVELTPGSHTLVVRAFDARGRGQPAELAEVWNVKGYANNAWHRITITVGD
jgi:sulfite oxidase